MPRKNNAIPHQMFKPSHSCEQKRRYVSMQKAEEAAEYRMLTTPNLELSVYQCGQCGGWHLTRKKRLV